MQRLFFILIAGLTFSCSVQHKVIGKYGGENIPDAFQLNADSTFKYEYKAYHAYLYSTGKWRMGKGSSILLNSDKERVVIPRVIEEGNNEECNIDCSLSVKFISKQAIDVADYRCEVFINDTLYSELKNGYLLSSGLDIGNVNKEFNIANPWFRYVRCDSLLSVKVKTRIKSIYFIIMKNPKEVTSTYFSPIALTTDKIFPNLGELSFFVEIDDSLIHYKAFSNEKIKLKKDKLYIFTQNQNNKKWRKIPRIMTADPCVCCTTHILFIKIFVFSFLR